MLPWRSLSVRKTSGIQPAGNSETGTPNAADQSGRAGQRNIVKRLTKLDNKLTNSISNDGILTRPPVTDHKKPSHQADNPSVDDGKTARAAQQGTDVDRAQQRLTQEIDLGGPSVPDSSGQAQALAETIAQQVTADPQGALRAMRQVSGTLFEAATARPTA